MPPATPSCLTCKWFVQVNESEGECHKHPPVINPHKQYHIHGFPIVITADEHQPWCSEYEENK